MNFPYLLLKKELELNLLLLLLKQIFSQYEYFKTTSKKYIYIFNLTKNSDQRLQSRFYL